MSAPVFYCDTCKKFFERSQIEDGKHTIIVQNGPDIRHVVQEITK